MKLNATYIKIRDKWWGLPLFLPSLILPIFAHINTFAHISSGEVFLFYLPLALMISMMMFFSWAALPGIAGNDSNLLIVFYVQIMPDDFVMQLHR
ncbi:MASE1 domain-containing protein, partial [Escherichia coli]